MDLGPGTAKKLIVKPRRTLNQMGVNKTTSNVSIDGGLYLGACRAFTFPCISIRPATSSHLGYVHRSSSAAASYLIDLVIVEFSKLLMLLSAIKINLV